MNKLSRALSVFIILSTLFSLAGCFDYSYIDETKDSISSSNQTDSQKSIDEININLTYKSSDSLNPYLAESESNRALSALMYDGLFAVDNNFKAIAQIAKDYTQDEEKITVNIKTGVEFSDSSSLSANDVEASFEAAKKSKRYKGVLSAFKEAKAINSSTIVFYFSNLCQDAVNLLSFPIFKIGSYDENAASKRDVPIGSGRYKLAENENSELYLTCNNQRLGGYSPVYKNIGLVSAADDETNHSLYSLGHANVLTETFSNGEYTQLIGASNKITMTNLVYLVCNKKAAVFEETNVKKAISLALNRQELVDYSFVSFAQASYTPFYPEYYKIKKRDTSNEIFSIQASNELLDASGYSNINPVYNFRHKDGKILELNLAVCKDNAFKLSAANKIKEQLDKVSIQINVRQYNEKDFLRVVSSGNYDLYLGECKLNNALDLSSFFTSGNSVASGIDTTSESAKIYFDFKKGSASIDEFLKSFSNDLPFIPLLYRSGAATSNTAMAVADDTIVTDYYYNAEKWKTIND